jgi:pimeloyl-ACP methyl ester carboxylesterase
MPKININGAKLFFDVYGSELDVGEKQVKNKPTLLVLHGGNGMVDHTLYVDFWSRFSDIAQVIFLDQRGCGRSDLRDSSEWNLAQWGRDVVDFCDALSIEKPIVAGVSMGGHVMCEYVKHYPNHAGGLIFCNTEAKFNVDDVSDAFARLGGVEIGDLARKNFTDSTPDIAEKFKEQCVPYYAKNAYTSIEVARCMQHMQVFEHYCKNEMKSFNYLDDVGKIKVPTLFMVGELSPGHPPKSAKTMAEKLAPQLVNYHEFKGAGAPVYNDSLEESEKVVIMFFQKLLK